jgi:hypothetical protein
LLELQGDTTGGFIGVLTIGLDLTDIEVGAADSMSGPGGGPPPWRYRERAMTKHPKPYLPVASDVLI